MWVQDNWDAAVELFQQLKSNQLGVRPNSVTYNILMSACLTRGRPQSVSADLPFHSPCIGLWAEKIAVLPELAPSAQAMRCSMLEEGWQVFPETIARQHTEGAWLTVSGMGLAAIYGCGGCAVE